jgi:hypothetical protein
MIIIKIPHCRNSTKILSQNRTKKAKSTPLANKYITVHFSSLVLNKADVKCCHASVFHMGTK